MNEVRVSVIIPCYKQADFLPDALESLLQQTYRNWEAIVVDDGSPDNTEEVATRYMRKDKRICYLPQENQGVSAARNNGIKQAKGEFILPLDADDWIKPTYLEKAVKVFLEHPETTLVYCLQCSDYEDKYPSPRYAGYKSLLVYNTIFCTAMFRKSDCLAIGGYDTDMTWGLEDWEFYIHLLNEQSVVVQLQEPLFFYRIKETSRNVTANLHLRELHQTIYRKHADVYGRLYDDPIVLLRRQREYEDTISRMTAELEHYRNGRKRWLKRLRHWFHLSGRR